MWEKTESLSNSEYCSLLPLGTVHSCSVLSVTSQVSPKKPSKRIVELDIGGLTLLAALLLMGLVPAPQGELLCGCCGAPLWQSANFQKKIKNGSSLLYKIIILLVGERGIIHNALYR